MSGLAIDGGSPVRAEYLVFGQPVIEQQDIDEVVDSLRKRWIGTGPKVARFEELVRQYVGTQFARAVSSCTAGLHLALLAAGARPGTEVVTTPLTFAATANAIWHTGARPIFVDVERTTQNIAPAALKEAVTAKTQVILPVHMAGRPCAMDEIGEIARSVDAVVIEDAAHGIGGQYRGRPIGSLADAGVFSFYATKNITTAEGGMVTTDNATWAEEIERRALHGLSRGAWHRYFDAGHKHYEVVLPGFKYNMTDLQAALGLQQFARLEPWLRRREHIWATYDDAFADLSVLLPAPPEPGTVHARHLYTPLLDVERLGKSRAEIQEALHHENVGTGVHFIALHEHAFYRDHLPYVHGDFPNAEWISRRTISLPLSPGLSDEDVTDVIEAFRKVLRAC